MADQNQVMTGPGIGDNDAHNKSNDSEFTRVPTFQFEIRDRGQILNYCMRLKEPIELIASRETGRRRREALVSRPILYSSKPTLSRARRDKSPL